MTDLIQFSMILLTVYVVGAFVGLRVAKKTKILTKLLPPGLHYLYGVLWPVTIFGLIFLTVYAITMHLLAGLFD